MAAPPSRHAELRRVLGFFDGLSLVVASVIGARILSTPALVAAHLRNPTFIAAIWAFGGLPFSLTALVMGSPGVVAGTVVLILVAIACRESLSWAAA